MEAFVYILYSPKLDKYYIGFTQDSVMDRLEKHRNGFYDNSYTQITDDWELYFQIECESIAQAMQIEKHIKRMKSRQYIINLKLYPEISETLKQKYKST